MKKLALILALAMLLAALPAALADETSGGLASLFPGVMSGAMNNGEEAPEGEEDYGEEEAEGSPQYASTQQFLALLDAEGVIYTYNGIDDDEDEHVRVSYEMDNTDIAVQLYFSSDGEGCSLRVWNLIDYSISNEANVIKVLDYLNRSYKFVRFYTDPSDNSVTVAMDVVFRTHDVGEIVDEAMYYVVKIGDLGYAELSSYAK